MIETPITLIDGSNYTIKTIESFHNGSTYNTGCITELQMMSEKCTTFKVEVMNTYASRFRTGFIILIILIFLRIIITNLMLKYEDKAWTKHPITLFMDDKIDVALIILSICLIFILYYL